MIDFALYSDSELRSFIKSANFRLLSEQELIDLHYELTEVSFRDSIPVPTKLSKEIEKRKLLELE